MENIPEEEKIFVLLKITKELILNSKTQKTLELERKLKILKEIEKNKRPINPLRVPLRRQIPQRNFNFQPLRAQEVQRNIPAQTRLPIEQQPVFNVNPMPQDQRQIQKLMIPEVNLPERFQYLKPVPAKEEINLGKLNPLIKDPNVKEIQCDGPNKEIIVKAPMPKKTPIVLNEQEIKEIFAAFSKAAKIPAEENIVKIAVSNLILNGINSDVIDSKFIIRKMVMPGFSGY